jgi:PEP-CTERM motif
MAKTQKVRLIAAATAFVALSLPGSSSAQFLPPSLGTWTGFDTFDITVTNFSTGQLISSDSGSGPATLSIGNDSMAIEGDHVPIFGTGGFTPSDPFGPTSASGGIDFNGGPGGSTVGNFFVTYESILPNGQIDVGNGSAVADLTTIEFDFMDPLSASTVIESFATFTTVPEPSSGMLAGLAILVIAAVACMRGFRRRLQARLS